MRQGLAAVALAAMPALVPAHVPASPPHAASAAVSGASGASPVTSPDPGAVALRARVDVLRDALEHSPLGHPIAIASTESPDRLEGEVVARLDHPFGQVSRLLDGTGHWCDLLMLHLNTKQCLAQADVLRLRVGRKWNQPAADAYALSFVFHALAAAPDFLRIGLTAADGPMGTRDYHIVVEAAPIDEQHTALRLRYDYGFGMMARLAQQGYASTIARSKVGFTVVGHDASGAPEYVGGMRGVVERNTMRYYLAIEALVDADALPAPQQQEHRLAAWFDATERYARQLHEMDRAEYLAMKRAELGRDAAIAAAASAPR